MVKCTSCGEENPPKFKLCGYCGTLLPAAAAVLQAHEVRKTVTLVFCDLKGSTALGESLDPEALHEVKERYFRAMAAEIKRHGGKIEKYIGDAVMAVFGLPRAHEDDALRAVRAAEGMRQALQRVNADLQARYGIVLANRTGVNTGEVVASDDPTADQKLATGDAVNVCARLEQAAPDNEVYLGDVTYRLVRDAVDAVPVAPLQLKGKAQPVPVWRLVAVHGQDGHVRRHDTRLVGRERELAAIGAIVDEMRAGGAARLVTVIGDAGVGKSRLVREVIDHVAAGARVLRGRCLSYGEDISFWPLLMMAREAAAIDDADPPETALAKLAACVGDADVADRLASAIGLSRAAYPLPEINWAARKFLAAAARQGPLVAFIDDIHWAAPAFLDLIEHVQEHGEDLPILLLATARDDLLEQRPQWSQQPGALRVVLQPLDDAATAQVVADRLGHAGLPDVVLQRIVRAAEGNPLYVEQMLSMLIDNGTLRLDGERWTVSGGDLDISVPPTIQALLEARLDQLARHERALVEPAAVIGLEFALGALGVLAPEAVRPAMKDHLDALSRKHFIRARNDGPADDVYRFHHQLVRDTVYNGLLKRARAQLHIEFVRWADGVNADRDQGLTFEEILGYHLEQAHRYLRELGPLDEPGRAIGRDGAQRLAAAGRRAAARGDMHAAARLLRRAAALLEPQSAARLALLPDLGEALMGLGDFAGARTALDEAAVQARQQGDRRIEAASRMTGIFLQLYSGEQPASWSEDTLHTAQALIPQLEALGADNEAASAWRLIVMVHGIAGRYSRASEAVEHSIMHARRAGNERLVARNGLVLAINALHGPTPVAQAIAQCEALLADGLSDRQVGCNVMCVLAQLQAMRGQLGEARRLYGRSRALLRDLGQGVFAASTGIDLARVELHGGDLALAEREVRVDYEFLAAKGETYFLSTMAALLACIVREQGRDDEALALTRVAEDATAEDDTESNALWRAVRAPILARRGELDAALGLARSAVELVRPTEAPLLKADTLSELALVLTLAGRDGEARAAGVEARAHYRGKGNEAALARLAARIDLSS